MFRNYLKVALRNIRRNKTFSFINIFGLAVGLASAMVIGLWVYQQWSHDRHFEDSDQIYRVGVNFMNIGDMAVGPAQLNDYLRDFPEVEQVGRLNSYSHQTFFEIDGKTFAQSNVYAADSTFFEVLSYDFIQGSPKNALKQPKSVIISKEVAEKLFSNETALGKTILVGDVKETFTVTGVVNLSDKLSHIPAEVFVNYRYRTSSSWLSANVYNYVKLNNGFSFEAFQSRLNKFIETDIYPTLSISQPYGEWIKTDAAYKFIVTPIRDIYMKSDLRFDLNTANNFNQVFTFLGIAILIVLIAALNFINIATAGSSKRAKEIGIRKTLGTNRRSLISQFLFESILISIIALILSFGFAELFLLGFEKATGLNLMSGILSVTIYKLLVISLTAVSIGLAAGIYPAIYLTNFKPVKVLKGQIHGNSGSQNVFRNSLVFVQFCIAITLLSVTVVVYQQLNFMQNKDLGFDKENTLIIENASDLGTHQQAFLQEALKISGIEKGSYNNRAPAGRSMLVSTLRSEEMNQGIPLQAFSGDHNLVETLGFRLISGRSFSEEIASDTNAIMLNQSAVKVLGLSDPIGKKLNNSFEIIGVISDFHYESLRKNIEPTVIEFSGESDLLALKLNAATASQVVPDIQTLWNSFEVDASLNYYFLDENYHQLIAQENILAKAVLIFSLLAIFISCLGLFGLSAFITEQRKSEIGMRKILGASVTQILILLNKNFTKPVLASMIISVPIAYFILKNWLNNFAYRTELTIWIFVGVCVLALTITWITVSAHSFRTAKMNPVDSLKSE